MKSRLDEGTVKKIYTTLLERFGEPIGKTIPDREAIADERGGKPHKGEEPGNRGFGSAKLYEGMSTCDQCGGAMGMDEVVCNQCGMMSGMGGGMDEAEGAEPPAPPPEPEKKTHRACPSCRGRGKVDTSKGTRMVCPHCKGRCIIKVTEGLEGGRHYGHAASCTCPDCSRTYEETHPPVDAPEPGMDEATVTLKEPGGSNSGQTGTTMTSSTAAPPQECEKCGGNRVGMVPGDMAKCKDCGHVWMPLDEMDEADLDEKAPPGRERQVKALKKDPDIDNPFAVAWASYNKKH